MNKELGVPILTAHEFGLYQKLILERLGIFMPELKANLIGSRLWSRLRVFNTSSFSDYFKIITAPENSQELDIVLNLITTNETYFFREIGQFQFLREVILPEFADKPKMRVWCAACSTGEEAYSLAMELEEYRSASWDLLASDINSSVLEKSKKAIYLDHRTDAMPDLYRKKYCLRGVDHFENYFRIVLDLRIRVKFERIPLHIALPDIGPFDVVFLRNVMIYFDYDTRVAVVRRIVSCMREGGYLVVGQSESLREINENLEYVKPGIYRLTGKHGY